MANGIRTSCCLNSVTPNRAGGAHGSGSSRTGNPDSRPGELGEHQRCSWPLENQQFKYWPEKTPESRAHSQPGPRPSGLGGHQGVCVVRRPCPQDCGPSEPDTGQGTFLSKWSHVKIVQTKPLPSGSLEARSDAGAQLPHWGEAGPGQDGASHRVTQRPSSRRKGGAEQAAPVPCPAQPEKQDSPEFGPRQLFQTPLPCLITEPTASKHRPGT